MCCYLFFVFVSYFFLFFFKPVDQRIYKRKRERCTGKNVIMH